MNVPIPASKKKFSVNEVEVKDTGDFKEIQKSEKKDFAADKKLKTSLKAIVANKVKDSANKDLEIYKDKDIQEACKNHGQKACWCCAGVVCLQKQTLALKSTNKRSYLGSCDGKPATIGNSSNYSTEFKPNNNSFEK